MTATLEQLDARVRALEDAPAPDSVAPNYITEDAQGHVSAHFSGTVDASSFSTLPAAAITGQLTDSQLQAIGANKVTGQLTDSQILAIAAAKVTGQLTDAQLASIAAGKIAGLITSGQLSVAQLSDIAAALGTITTGILRGVVHETSAGDPKVRFDPTGFFVTEADGTHAAQLDTSGLDFRAGASGAPPDTRRLRWLFGDGTPSAGLFGYGSQGASVLKGLNVGAGSIDNATTDRALLAFSADSAGAQSVVAAAGSHTPKVIDQAGVSDFLQLAATAKRKINFGNANVVASGSTVVAHGLGAAPVAVLCTTHYNAAGGPAIAWIVANPDATNFTIYNPTANTSDVFWLAIG